MSTDEKIAIKKSVKPLLEDDFETYYKKLDIPKDAQCGYWIFRQPFMQILASKKAYTVLYAIVGCIYTAVFSYFMAILTTLEKVLKISSKRSGFIATGNNITQLFLTVLISYYVSKKHRPRALAIGLFTTFLFCLINSSPYYLYGATTDSLRLTKEYGASLATVGDYVMPTNLCSANRTHGDECIDETESNDSFLSQCLLMVGQLLAGIGASILAAVGITYIDDNVQKSVAPIIVSVTFFFRMLGPALGFGLASYFLQFYVEPTLTPVIDKTDPRWIGAWWMGWVMFGIAILVCAFAVSLFPKELPRAYARRKYQEIKLKMSNTKIPAVMASEMSWFDLKTTFKRILTNKVYVLNTINSIFMVFSFMPMALFAPKYMEVQFRIAAADASFLIGSIVLPASASGILLSGFILSKIKPSAKRIIGINIAINITCVLIFFAFSKLSCQENELAISTTQKYSISANSTICNLDECSCDYIKYAPICGSDNITYISPCHAGCSIEHDYGNGTIHYNNCSCINDKFSTATKGACLINCKTPLWIYISVISVQNFVGGLLGTSMFLLTFRSMEQRDKVVSVGFQGFIINLFGFIPAPVVFGYIFDLSCIVWGQTCGGSGNCWLYESSQLRTNFYYTLIGVKVCTILCDFLIFGSVKNIKLFDDEIKKDEENDHSDDDGYDIIDKK